MTNGLKIFNFIILNQIKNNYNLRRLSCCSVIRSYIFILPPVDIDMSLHQRFCFRETIGVSRRTSVQTHARFIELYLSLMSSFFLYNDSFTVTSPFRPKFQTRLSSTQSCIISCSDSKFTVSIVYELRNYNYHTDTRLKTLQDGQ